jgi:hypothetical protein
MKSGCTHDVLKVSPAKDAQWRWAMVKGRDG